MQVHATYPRDTARSHSDSMGTSLPLGSPQSQVAPLQGPRVAGILKVWSVWRGWISSLASAGFKK